MIEVDFYRNPFFHSALGNFHASLAQVVQCTRRNKMISNT